jgi:hypothetical protein
MRLYSGMTLRWNVDGVEPGLRCELVLGCLLIRFCDFIVRWLKSIGWLRYTGRRRFLWKALFKKDVVNASPWLTMNNEVNDGLYRLLWEVEICKKDRWIPMKYSDPFMNEVISITEWVLMDYSVLQGSVPYLLGYLSRNREEPCKNENSFR